MITSRDNETLKLVRKLLGQRKHRDETGLFAAEGEDLVEAAKRAGIEPVHVLVAGETVEEELLARVSTLPHPARAIGVYRRADLPTAMRSTCLALWRLSDPGNVGTLLRTADAFGASVALSEGCADPTSPKALRASAGAVFRTPVVPWDARPGRCVALVAHGGAPLSEAELSPPVTLLVGAERAGLPNEQVTQCHKATIAVADGAESLNVAAAGAIALYEATRAGA
ncbi:MAG TPA: RNA methyltransferase [Gaiella sp.]|nr:RNA methyltransferase [Gaiella sp.]